MFQKSLAGIVAAILAVVILGFGSITALAWEVAPVHCENLGGTWDPDEEICRNLTIQVSQKGPNSAGNNSQGRDFYSERNFIGTEWEPLEETTTETTWIAVTYTSEQSCTNPEENALGGKAVDKNPNCQLP